MAKKSNLVTGLRFFALLLCAPILIPLVILMLVGILAGYIGGPLVRVITGRTGQEGPELRPRGFMDRTTGEIPGVGDGFPHRN
jgi:hypothetical protein